MLYDDNRHSIRVFRRAHTSFYSSNYNRHPGCDCPEGFAGENCQFVEEVDNAANTALIVGIVIVVSSILVVFFLLRIRRRQRMTKLYENMAKAQGVPPSLDLMARSLQIDMEYGESGEISFEPAPSTPDQRSRSTVSKEDLVYMRRSEWPNGQTDSTDASSVFKDIPVSPMSQTAIINSRKQEWPNDAHNDASNPIQIFDDISVSTPNLSPISSRKII